jgi:hypothetical protein
MRTIQLSITSRETTEGASLLDSPCARLGAVPGFIDHTSVSCGPDRRIGYSFYCSSHHLQFLLFFSPSSISNMASTAPRYIMIKIIMYKA